MMRICNSLVRPVTDFVQQRLPKAGISRVYPVYVPVLGG